MCGIIGRFVTDNNSIQAIKNGVKLLSHRGPDANGTYIDENIMFGHTRLSIIDLSTRSNQPFIYKNIVLVFNGEIWNYKKLRNELQKKGLKFTTESDTEVVAAIIHQYGVDGLNKINGMFAVAWKTIGEDCFYIARDIFGEIPIHLIPKYPFSFCSEIKVLKEIGCNMNSLINIPPGSFAKINSNSFSIQNYYNIPLSISDISQEKAAVYIQRYLYLSVKERSISDVPICTLLSGGIDSSVIAYLLSKFSNHKIVAYTAVFNEKSKDLKYSRILAKECGFELREIHIPIPDKNDLKNIIKIIEEPHKAQIEIGYICYHLAKQIKKDGFKVVFSGEGSDELFASYSFSYHALKTQDFHEYRKLLFLNQERKNFNRMNKIFMHFGIEGRLPFLNKKLVEIILSLPAKTIRQDKNLKYILSKAFVGKINNEILFRPKIAFQDGAGIKEIIESLFGGKHKAISFYKNEYKKMYSSNFKGFKLCQ